MAAEPVAATEIAAGVRLGNGSVRRQIKTVSDAITVALDLLFEEFG
jgi:hypothetical protein